MKNLVMILTVMCIVSIVNAQVKFSGKIVDTKNETLPIRMDNF